MVRGWLSCGAARMVKVRGRRCAMADDVTNGGRAVAAAAVGSHDDCHGGCSRN